MDTSTPGTMYADSDTSYPGHLQYTLISDLEMDCRCSHSSELVAALHTVPKDGLLQDTAQPECRTEARPANAEPQAQQSCLAHPTMSKHDVLTLTGPCKFCTTMAMLLTEGSNECQRQDQLKRTLEALQRQLSQMDLQLHLLQNQGTDVHPFQMVREVSELLDQQGSQCLLEADLQEQVTTLTYCLHMLGWYVTEQRAAVAGQAYV